ncbi:DNA-damage-inducible MATE, Na+/Multidrug efflux [Alkalihalophilus pseudofirmus OF4]|uniref:DNA-damage-inducible MATE, Na+/Multidrug efflux n=1 Tax=Alkalihalophilus pseudofirmus (strain ATCC BAA-2126 / JCM 17055 / OF4) TaxID=398511 RepID=D3FRG1_ALKPO|nr:MULTISPECIES: MATE family efflux transporter [Alkalihalophilus]ADC51552.1 DNA-damage-inducible MATE, Na+/Multidrug efflux [Alkalihalophilus pseudofirmus OF4]MED1603341.1 MATE family efflux transporter [Alkalihalophilus marmarensis]
MQTKRNSLEDYTIKSVSQRQYLLLAIPLIISGISTPILGAVDTAVIGRMPDAAAIGGVAIGAVIFNTMYWLLGFLRVSTSGFTAQASGANNYQEMMLSFIRPMILALLFGFFFITFQQPIIKITISILGGSETVSAFAESYFSIRIWGAPFALANYVIIGWLIGMGRVRLSLITQLFMNLLNIILDLVFVLGLNMGVQGVASATLIAEVSAVLFGIGLILYTKDITFSSISYSKIMDVHPLLKMAKVNRDLFLRTICLLIMTGIFTAMGASMGEVTLAANAILLQIHYLMAYLFGGFANASSILVGRAIGENNKEVYKRAYKLSAQWGISSAVIMALVMWLLGPEILSLFTTIPEVRATAHTFLIWMVLFPIVGFWGLQLEGIFSGATEAKSIRNSIFYALIVFLLVIWLLVPVFLNHGIWFAFIIFSLSRSIFLSLFIPKLNRMLFHSPHKP